MGSQNTFSSRMTEKKSRIREAWVQAQFYHSLTHKSKGRYNGTHLMGLS